MKAILRASEGNGRYSISSNLFYVYLTATSAGCSAPTYESSGAVPISCGSRAAPAVGRLLADFVRLAAVPE